MNCELYNDNFQNYKVYGIPKAQLVIADVPYQLQTRTRKDKARTRARYIVLNPCNNCKKAADCRKWCNYKRDQMKHDRRNRKNADDFRKSADTFPTEP